ncbi:MAG: SMR family transporter [Bacillota bacterium]
MPVIYLLAIGSILLGGVGQFLLKLGAQKLPAGASLLRTIMQLFAVPQILLGLVCFGTSFIAWIFVLRRLELSVAYPLVSLSYATVTLLSVVFLHESFTIYKLVGLVLIMLGVVVLNIRPA